MGQLVSPNRVPRNPLQLGRPGTAGTVVSSLKGPALTAHRCFSPVRQEEGASTDPFRDRVYAMTNQAYPDLVNAPTLLQSFAVPAFAKGLRDRNAAQEAMKFRDPKSIQEAVVTVTHIQGASRIFGNRGVPTVRQVSFEDWPITEAAHGPAPGVVRQLQQFAVTSKVTPTSDARYTCGGSDHRSRDCANKRRRLPSPLTCFECNGKGHIAGECSNRLRRRKETVRARPKHQYRCTSSSQIKALLTL